MRASWKSTVEESGRPNEIRRVGGLITFYPTEELAKRFSSTLGIRISWAGTATTPGPVFRKARFRPEGRPNDDAFNRANLIRLGGNRARCGL